MHSICSCSSAARVTTATALVAGDPEAAVSLYRGVLGLWRGDSAGRSGIRTVRVTDRRAARRAEARRRRACLDAELELGRGAELVPELEQLVGEHPLSEGFRGQLMVALYRAGRQAEALETFPAGRAALVEAFGLEPTPALKELESRVLLQDPALDGPSSPRPVAAREDARTVLVAARDGGALDALAAVGKGLAALGRHELLITQVVADETALAEAVAATRSHRDRLAADGVTSRAAAFVSRAFGADAARADARCRPAAGRLRGGARGRHGAGGARAPAGSGSQRDVALLGSTCRSGRRMAWRCAFGGGDHDWGGGRAARGSRPAAPRGCG